MTARSTDAKPTELSAEVRQTWKHFLEVYEPLRPALYRFCRYLTRSAWDADLPCRSNGTFRARGSLP
jgi:hypothetical protein